MNNLPRIEQLLHFILEDPGDPFNYYALALEYQELDKALAYQYFNKLLTDFPEYLPTYYHAANFFINNENTDKVRQIYEKGIELSVRQNNQHAKKELENAFLNFQIAYE
nr:tetratricopeptide repeat protein [Cytophagales bacterium]